MPPLLFRRRPPQSNYPPDTVPSPDNGSRLDLQTDKGGISRLTPSQLASRLQRLPPILHRSVQKSMPSYSKGARGLSVLLRVSRHFHRHYNFTESIIKTAPNSLRHSCRSELHVICVFLRGIDYTFYL